MQRREDPYFIPGADDENDDSFGQSDGDGSVGADFPSGVAEFRPGSAGQPWLRAALPPWHLWGNSQRLTATFGAGTGLVPQTGQLVKISYKRPESWHWLFSARLVEGPDSAGGIPAPIGALVTVSFGLTIGIGRSQISMTAGDTPPFGRSAGFETFSFRWGPVTGAFPRNVHLYSTEVLAPNRFFSSDVPTDQSGNAIPGIAPGLLSQSASRIQQVVAQDLQVDCVVRALALPGDAAFGLPVTVELSAAFAPKTHLRPDWQQKVPPEIAFAGQEVGGT